MNDRRTGIRAYFDTGRASLVGAAAFALALFVASAYRHVTFRSTLFDLGVFEQTLWKLAHLRAPVITAIGANAFADHFSPALVPLAVLYRLAPSPFLLFAIQAIALAIGLLAIGPLADAAGAPLRVRTAFRLAFALSPLVWNAALFDFHPTTLAVPVLLVAAIAAVRDDLPVLIVCAVVLVALRDDLGAAAAMMALAGMTTLSSGRRRWRWLVFAGALVWLVAGGAIGGALGSSRYWAPRYGYLGPSPVSAAVHPFRTIPRLARHVFEARNATLAVAALVPLGFLPVLSPRRLALAVGLALPLFAARDNNFHALVFHYWAPFVPFFFLAAASGVRRLRERLSELTPAWMVGVAAVTLVTLGPPRSGSLTRHTVSPDDARRALHAVRPGDRVSAGIYLGPHVANRTTLYSFPAPFDPRRERFSSSAAARIDVVIVERPRTTNEADAAARFEHDWSAEFGRPQRFGSVLVYRKTGGVTGPEGGRS